VTEISRRNRGANLPQPQRNPSNLPEHSSYSHDYSERQVRDAAQEEAMEDLGYMVIRFGHQDNWTATLAKYPYVFGGEG
jgi:hypothetical protein